MSATVATLVTLALAVTPVGAIAPGKAAGTFTLDGTSTPLPVAVSTAVAGLFDESKKDTLVVLADRDLGDLAADDEVGMHVAAREGRLVALALRLDGAKLVNLTVHAAGLDGEIKLPGAWFTWKPSGPAAGSLALAERAWDGHRFACSLLFVGAPARAAAAKAPAVATTSRPPSAATPAAARQAAPPVASTASHADPQAMAKIVVAAIMAKDEAQAVRLVESGVDPNLRDDSGIPLLNWAVMSCMPRLTRALVAKGADVKVERAPGLTILTEAGACPEAAAILRAAGAR